MSLLHDRGRDDLIPADAVDDLLRRVRVGVEQLDVELKQAQLEIVQLEAELASHAHDVQPGDDRLEAARTAIEGAAVGAQDHIAKVVAAARAHADARVAAAEAEAGWILQAAREDVARSLVAPLGVGDPIPAADLALAAPVVPPAAQLARWGPPPETESALPASTAPPRAPVPAAAGPAAPPVARPPAADPSLSEQPEAAGFLATADMGQPAETLAERAFWADEIEPPSRRAGADLLLTGVSALLVVAILAIVLAWIG